MELHDHTSKHYWIDSLWCSLKELLKYWGGVYLLSFWPYFYIQFHIYFSDFCAYLGLLPSFYCLCLFHNCGNMFSYYQVLCYQYLLMGPHPKWSVWGGNLNYAKGEKWNGRDFTLAIFRCNTIVFLQSRSPSLKELFRLPRFPEKCQVIVTQYETLCGTWVLSYGCLLFQNGGGVMK